MSKELDVKLEIGMAKQVELLTAKKELLRSIIKNVERGGDTSKEIALKDLEILRLHYQESERVGREALRQWREHNEG